MKNPQQKQKRKMPERRERQETKRPLRKGPRKRMRRNKSERGTGEKSSGLARERRQARTGYYKKTGRTPTKAPRRVHKERGSGEKEDTGIAQKTRNTGKGDNSTTEETTRDNAQRTRTRRAVARHQKEDHLAKGVNEGTNNIKQRENKKRRNEEPGTSKERKSPMAKQTR